MSERIDGGPVRATTGFEPSLGGAIAGLGWVAAAVVQSVALAAAGGGAVADEVSIGALAVAIVAGWAVLLAAVVVASRRAGTGVAHIDVGIGFRPADLLGIPLGVACQVVMLPVLYAPLRWVWPDAFGPDQLEERARSLVDRADGAWLIVLWLVVVAGAPFVEEVFYRGLVQRSLTAWSVPGGIGATAAVFGLIHFAPVELPGLVAFGLVLGTVAWRTGRLGGAIVTHVAFNATALVLLT